MKTDLERFLAAYIECALWAATRDDGDNMDDLDESDIASATLARMREDCAKFIEQNRAVLDACDGSGALPLRNDEARERGIADAYAMAGHDFWLTRNGHGAGFWDGDWDIDLPAPEGGFSAQAGDVLTDAARTFGEVNLYVGDDGQVWQ